MDRSSDGPEVIYQEIFCNQRRKKGSTIPDILRKPQTGCQSANRSIFITGLKQVKGVKNIEPSENQSLSGIVHRHVVPELVIEAPQSQFGKEVARAILSRANLFFSSNSLYFESSYVAVPSRIALSSLACWSVIPESWIAENADQ